MIKPTTITTHYDPAARELTDLIDVKVWAQSDWQEAKQRDLARNR